MNKKYIILLFILIIFNTAFAQKARWLWANASTSYKVPAYNEGSAICLDKAGNNYVVGSIGADDISFGSGVSLHGLGYRMFVTKFSKNGQAIWARQSLNLGSYATSINGKSTIVQNATSIVIDSSANIYIAGYFWDTVLFGNKTMISRGNQDVFITKLDSSGNFLWTKQIGSKTNEVVNSITIDKKGNIFIAGETGDSAVFDTTTIINGNMGKFFIAKYTSQGNVIWAKYKGGTNGNVWSHGAKSDDDGNIFVTGQINDTVTFDSISLKISNNGIFIVKFDTAGNTIWAKKANDLTSKLFNQQRGNAVDVDKQGNCYITGSFNGTVTFDTTKITSLKGYNSFIAKYNSNGKLSWVKRAGNDGVLSYYSYLDNENGAGIKIDDIGNCYVGGTFNQGGLFDTTHIHSLDDASYVVKYDSTGKQIWVKTGGLEGSLCKGIAIDKSGDAYVTGYFSDYYLYFDSIRISNQYISTNYSSSIYVARVHEDQKPIVNFAVKDTTICSNDLVRFTDLSTNYPAKYQWTFPNGKPNISKLQNPSVSYATSGVYKATLIISNLAGADTISKTFTVSIKQLPTVTIIQTSGKAKFCYGDSSTLSASKSYSYLWSNNDTTQTIHGKLNGHYFVTVTDSNGCSSVSNTIGLTAYALPNIAISGDTSICTGESTKLTAQIANSYLWNTGAKTASITVSPTQNTFYSVTGTIIYSGNGISCSKKKSVLVSVNQLPNATVSQSNDTLIANQKGASYQWIDCATAKSIPNATTQFFAPTVTGNYKVVVTQNGCSSTSVCNSVIITGIQSVNLNSEVTIYPNPTSTNVTINGLQPVNQIINITNIVGETVQTEITNGVSNVELNVNNLPSGLYFISVGGRSYKFVKE